MVELHGGHRFCGGRSFGSRAGAAAAPRRCGRGACGTHCRPPPDESSDDRTTRARAGAARLLADGRASSTSSRAFADGRVEKWFVLRPHPRSSRRNYRAKGCQLPRGCSDRRRGATLATRRRARLRRAAAGTPPRGVQPVLRLSTDLTASAVPAMRSILRRRAAAACGSATASSLHYDVAGRVGIPAQRPRGEDGAPERARRDDSTLDPAVAVHGQTSIPSRGTASPRSTRLPAAWSSTTTPLVDIAHRIVDPADVVAEGPAALPAGSAAVPSREPLLPGRPRPAERVGQLRPACRAAMRRCGPFATGFGATSGSAIGTSSSPRRRCSIRCATASASAATSRTR